MIAHPNPTSNFQCHEIYQIRSYPLLSHPKYFPSHYLHLTQRLATRAKPCFPWAAVNLAISATLWLSPLGRCHWARPGTLPPLESPGQPVWPGPERPGLRAETPFYPDSYILGQEAKPPLAPFLDKNLRPTRSLYYTANAKDPEKLPGNTVPKTKELKIME